VLLVTGMSGAGRSTVSTALDDLGWFIIDNLPVDLIVRVSGLLSAGNNFGLGVAFIVGRSGHEQPAEVMAMERELRDMHPSVKMLFLDAPDDVLISRYEGTRRRHPHEGNSLAESIANERVSLSPLRQVADLVIDTGTITPHQLRQRIVETYSEVAAKSMRVSVISFGFSNGLPRDVDVVLDCRFLPNPHWIEELRPLSGLDHPVSEYVLSQEPAQHFLKDVASMLHWQIPAFEAEGKSYFTVAIGCTGGRHRSVAIAEELRRMLEITTPVFHRDILR